jgi:hypothetical protein
LDDFSRLPGRVQRQVGREMALANASGSLLAAREVAKVRAIADITETALIAVSTVSAVEGLLISRTPHAEGRLRHVADAGTAGIANVVLRAAGRLA